MRVLGTVSSTGFLFAGKRGEAYQIFSGIFLKTPRADLVRVPFIVHEQYSQNAGIKEERGWRESVFRPPILRSPPTIYTLITHHTRLLFMESSKKITIQSYPKLAAAILFCLIVGSLGSLVTTSGSGSWYASLEKPFFAPPNWVFAPVWITVPCLAMRD
jgi:hypothetical protein